jgi:hypothetical protein
LRAGAPLESLLSAFDDGPTVFVETPGSHGAGHLTIAYLYEAPVKLGVCVTAEEYKLAGGSVLKDQVILTRGYTVPYGPDLQEQLSDAQSEHGMFEMARQAGEKQTEADKEDSERLTDPIEAGQGGSRRASGALSFDNGTVEQPVEQHQSEQDAPKGDESEC